MTDPAKVAAATIRANVQAGIELAATGYTPEALESMALETIRAALREHAPADVADALHTFPFWEEWGDKLSVDDRFAMHDAITALLARHTEALRERVAELTKTHGEDNREFLGRMVRLAWMEWAKEQHDPKPSWLVPWGQMSERMKEVDRRIGERIASVALPLWVDDRAEVERLRERAELAEKSRDAFKKVACENAALLRTLNGVPWQGDEDHIAALAVRLRAENERLRKRLAGECETCGGSGLMDAFSGYGERGEEITEQATCAECQGSGFGWMADTVKERDRLRSLMREMHRTVLAQSAREAELRGSQKAALDDILASIDDARRISPEWPAALWQGFNRIDAGVRAARKRVEPRDGEEGPEPMTPEQIHAKVVEGNEDARETVERLRELLRVARALRHECARHDAAVAPGVRVGGPRFPPSTRRLLQPLCDAVDALGGGEED